MDFMGSGVLQLAKGEADLGLLTSSPGPTPSLPLSNARSVWKDVLRMHADCLGVKPILP